MLRKQFERIKCCTRPSLKRTDRWWCKSVCHYGKTPHPKDPSKNICRYIYDRIARVGIEQVMREETVEGFSVGYYHSPGS